MFEKKLNRVFVFILLAYLSLIFENSSRNIKVITNSWHPGGQWRDEAVVY